MSDKTFDIRFVETFDGAGGDQLRNSMTEDSAAIAKVTGESEKRAVAITEETAAINAAVEAQARLNAEKEAAREQFGDSFADSPGTRIADNSGSGTHGLNKEGSGRYEVDPEVPSTVPEPSLEEKLAMEAKFAEAENLKLATAEKELAIEAELLRIEELKKDALIATTAGESEKAGYLAAELRARALIVTELRNEQISTPAQLKELRAGQQAYLEEVNASLLARNLELETMEAQRALNTELIAQEAAKQAAQEEAMQRLTGPRSRATQILKNFMGPNEAMAAGIGIFAGVEAKRLIDEYSESLNKAAEAQIKLNDERAKFTEHVANLKDVTELEKMRGGIEEKINDLLAERSIKEGAARDAVDGQISALQGQVAHLDRITSQVIEREEKERDIKLALEEQLKALGQVRDKEKEITQEIERRLKLQEQLEEIQLGAGVAAINRKERDGQITHQQAEQQRQALQTAAATQKYQEEEQARQEKINELASGQRAAEAQAAEKQSEYDATGKAFEGGAAKQAEITAKQQAAQLAAANAKQAGEAVQDEAAGRAPEDPLTDEGFKKLQQKAKDAQEAAAKAQQEAAATAANPPDMKALEEAHTNAAKERDKAAELATAAARENLAQVRKIQEEGSDATKVFNARTAAQGPEQADKIAEAAKRDKEEALEAQKTQYEAQIAALQKSGTGKETPAVKAQIAALKHKQEEIDKELVHTREHGAKAAADTALINAKESTQGPDKDKDKSLADQAEAFAASNTGLFDAKHQAIQAAAEHLRKAADKTAEGAALDELIKALNMLSGTVSSKFQSQEQQLRAQAAEIKQLNERLKNNT